VLGIQVRNFNGPGLHSVLIRLCFYLQTNKQKNNNKYLLCSIMVGKPAYFCHLL